jgi:hypothetical protein
VKTKDISDKINDYNKSNYEIISIIYQTADPSLASSFGVYIHDKVEEEIFTMTYKLIDSEKNQYEVKFGTEKIKRTEDDYRELLEKFDGYKKIENININFIIR